jgi:hypothetical protein
MPAVYSIQIVIGVFVLVVVVVVVVVVTSVGGRKSLGDYGDADGVEGGWMRFDNRTVTGRKEKR